MTLIMKKVKVTSKLILIVILVMLLIGCHSSKYYRISNDITLKLNKDILVLHNKSYNNELEY